MVDGFVERVRIQALLSNYLLRVGLFLAARYVEVAPWAEPWMDGPYSSSK